MYSLLLQFNFNILNLSSFYPRRWLIKRTRTILCSNAEMLDVLDLKDIHYGMWVKVKYEGEIILGNILSVVNNQTQFWCLKLPFGIIEPQGFEQEEDAVFYETVYATGATPVMVKMVKNECRDTDTRHSLLSCNSYQFKLKEKAF